MALDRQRTSDEVVLLRTELTAAQTTEFFDLLQACLTTLRNTFQQRQYTVVGQVPADADVLGRVRAWIDSCGPAIAIATAPHVRPKP